MKGKQIVEMFGINAKHALYKEDGTWYHHLKLFPGVLFDLNGYIVFQNESEYSNNPFLKHTEHLHIHKGIESIPGYNLFNKDQRTQLFVKDLINKPQLKEDIVRKVRQIEFIVRNRGIVADLKKLYKDCCQLCETQIKIADSLFYSEVHHLIPLGGKHGGPDNLGNMLCVCPNCHVRLDLGAVKLEKDTLKILLHDLSEDSLKYNNNIIYKYQISTLT